jgi:exodeoxyribonuclease VII large subunit
LAADGAKPGLDGVAGKVSNASMAATSRADLHQGAMLFRSPRTILHNYLMANIFLTVSFKEKDAAKALGARWDGAQRQWFVPEGRDLTPFAAWLPADATLPVASTSTAVARAQDGGSELALPTKKGVSLSVLLAGVTQAVAQLHRAGVWTMVEVVELRGNGGHIFLGVSERDSAGTVLAKASAVIWQSIANTILPAFERATGAQLAPGIKLLVRARPVFKAVHGFSLEIDAIDPEYTLGDLEARKREIRARLRAEGVFDANKKLPAPWDFNAVLVVAPEGGAGLGDFQAEADRLAQFGICRFVYAYSRFQGEGAAREIADALMGALQAWDSKASRRPDAVVLIRGGGAVNDLAWLNDYDLARCICDLPIPVLTGIGHERDSTVIDELANAKFDTPSKVIAGIEQVIVRRTSEAKVNFDLVSHLAARALQTAKAASDALLMSARGESLRHLAQAKQATHEFMSTIRLDAMQEVRSASDGSRGALQDVRAHALRQLSDAKRDVPAFWDQIAMGSMHATQVAAADGRALMGSVLERAGRVATLAEQGAVESFEAVAMLARQHVRDGADRSEAFMREIAGQGPEKTLSRGFAIVRNEAGQPVTRASQAKDGSAIDIQFHDGKVTATTGHHL